VGATDDTSGFEIDLGQARRVDRLRMNGIKAPFLKRLRLEGSGDRAHWTVLVDDGTVFDLPAESLRRTTLDFAPGEFQYLRVTWDDRNSAVVAAPQTVEAHLAGAALPPPVEFVDLAFERRASEPGKSRFRVHLPGTHLPIVALDLVCAGGHVRRTAQVTEPRLSGSEVAPVALGSHTLQRAERDGLVAADLRIPITRPSGAEVDLVVDDDNNPPLDVLAVRAQLTPLPWIYFESAAGDSLVAHYGDASLAAPHYDLEAVRDAVGRVPLANARWGEVRSVTATAPTPLTSEAVPARGAPLDPKTFTFSRVIPAGAPGLTALLVDAAMLAHSRNLHDVRIADGKGFQVPYVVERMSEPLSIDLPLPEAVASSTPAPPHASHYRVQLPFDSLPPAQLVLSTRARIFDRFVGVTAELPRVDGRSAPGAISLAVRRWRHADRDQPAPDFVVALPGLNVATLQLWIDEGDNSPLPLETPRLLLPGYRLRFFRDGADALSLLYGARQLGAPQYDLALLASQVLGVGATEVVALDEGSGGVVPPAEHGTLTEQRVFWVALIAAVVALLAVTARLILPSGRANVDP